MANYDSNQGYRTVFTTTTHGPSITTTTHSASGHSNTVTTTNARHNTNFTTTPNTTSVTHPTITTTHRFPIPQVPAAAPSTQAYRPSIRIRRQGTDRATQTAADQGWLRRKSSSEPQRPDPVLLPQDDLAIRRQATATPLQTLHEEDLTVVAPYVIRAPVIQTTTGARRPGLARNPSSFGSLRSRVRNGPEYDARVVDMLDVIDPEVSTLTTLNNVQNSLFIPNLGSFYRRQPTYDLSQASPNTDDEIGPVELEASQVDREGQKEDVEQGRPNALARQATISSVLTSMSESHNYAVLPHGASLPGWTAEQKAALNDHVRHLLHSRRAKFKRTVRGFGCYVRKPVGFLVSLYAFLITFWGAAWVLFLIGWIGVGDRQAYFIEICDQILVALFCVVGIGFSPFRAIDTYHMIFVAHYAHLTWKLRQKRGLPKLRDRNELPSRPNAHAWCKLVGGAG
ncbi:hypothetical protein P154DRAFT_565249 [Amniculicola lignicola CBS 123094]|uniref:Integral membrane protein n=1 Tax=Amniculicola lignicola CBS 123094 TaxID=1392246 RepID=A0A6A5W753_9PLEO|nr:hypothetical protein P154DRAFT_565249 [Amniculicola lignicola CBS 123094]